MPISATPRVLVLGGGYAGLYAARTLQNQVGHPVEITVVDPNPYMTYQPLLPEVAGGHVAPADVLVSLRRDLKRCTVIRGRLAALDSVKKQAEIELIDGSDITLGYDQVIVAMGAVTRVFPTPGLSDNAVGFKTVEEAVYTHNRVLEQVAFAASTHDPAARAKALTFVFVGGGYTGVEALFELSNLSKRAIAEYPDLAVSDLRWVLIEALDRVAPEVGPELSKWTLGLLKARGIDVRLETTMPSCVDGNIELSTGETIPAGTIVWTAGVQPNPVLGRTDLPRGAKGHVIANSFLQVTREDGTIVEGAWALGDNAQVPDLTAQKQPAFYPPNAQNAVRQGPVVARNVLATIAGEPLTEYRHESVGTVASYGIGWGAALIKGVKLRGLPAWLAHRGYHVLAMPTFRRKVRILIGWIAEALTGTETVSLKAIETPRDAFTASFTATKKQ